MSSQHFKFGDIREAIPHEGYYYIASGQQFYRVSVNGEIEKYSNLENAKYTKGVYNFHTNTYDPTPIPSWYSVPYGGQVDPDVFEPKKIALGNSIKQFMIDPSGNIVIYDDIYKILRRIHVFHE